MDRPLWRAASRAAIRAVASKTANSVNCGMVETDRTICLAMALRMPTTLIRWSSSWSACGAGRAVPGRSSGRAAASTSARVIRPPGPLPATAVRSTPSSRASWRTKGAARTPSSVDAEGLADDLGRRRTSPGPGVREP